MAYRSLVRLAAVLTFGLAAASASAGEFLEQNGAALGGNDPFTYLGSTPYPTSGSRELSYTYKDSKFYFLTPGHLRDFADNPERYAPQFGGYDAYGVSQGLKTPAHPRVFAVVDGKLYLFSDAESRKNWKKDVKGNILRASEQWPRIAQLAMR